MKDVTVIVIVTSCMLIGVIIGVTYKFCRQKIDSEKYLLA